jgi:hypothetical protein
MFSSILKEHGAYIVQKDSVYQLFDLNGKAFNKETYKNIQSLSTPAWVLERANDWVLVDSSGKTLLSNLHDPMVLGNKVKYYDGTSMLSFHVTEKGQIKGRQSFDNVAKLKVNGYMESIAKPNISSAGPGQTDASSRWYLEDKTHKWGLKLADGKIVIPPMYDYIVANQVYGYTLVYIKKASKMLDLMGENYLYTAKAGLVNDKTGKEIIAPKYLDIFLTGTIEQPLFFGITDDFRYQQIQPNSKEKMPVYAWVDAGTAFPIRALAGNGLDRKAESRKDRVCSRIEMTNRINNPTFTTNAKRHYKQASYQGMTSSLKKWV